MMFLFIASFLLTPLSANWDAAGMICNDLHVIIFIQLERIIRILALAVRNITTGIVVI